ncbi:hypothetical protein JHD46_05350 [Sulfurimonas sp. SAG-AH-194-C20]|nr:hypothetical protein [Sulfurimonas sp. SAG-AH-194-C20]MDF1879065.1 hypothetical protein [Sulfurimonas sp. SAG-AH-194-C20]
MTKVHFVDKSYIGHKDTISCSTACSTRVSMTSDEEKVTCCKCLKIIRSETEGKMYKVSYLWYGWGGETLETHSVKALSPAAAKYKVFKIYCYDDEQIASRDFANWISCSCPTVRLDASTKKESLTPKEEIVLKRKKVEDDCLYWKNKLPVGAKVLFHRDGSSVCTIEEVERPIFVANEVRLGIFLVGVSGYYSFSSAFVRPYIGNEKLLGKSLKDN